MLELMSCDSGIFCSRSQATIQMWVNRACLCIDREAHILIGKSPLQAACPVVDSPEIEPKTSKSPKSPAPTSPAVE